MNTKQIKLILISFICLFTFPISAQEKIIMEGKVTINNRVYSVSKSSPKYKNGGLWVKYNVEFIQKQESDPKPYTIVDYGFATTETFKSAVIRVLGRSRIMELSADRYLLMTIYPGYTGKIKAMKFRIPNDHLITIEELDRISSYIENNISFKIPGPVRADHKIPPLIENIRFAELLK